MAPGRRLARVGMALLVIGVAWRLAVVALGPDHFTKPCDGRIYWNIATNLANGDGFLVDDPGIPPECVGREPGPSHHYGPLMPLVEAGAQMLFGATFFAGNVALLMISLGLLAAMFAATRDLFGRDAAWLATGALSVDWIGVHYGTEYGYAENLVQLTFLGTLWAIVRSVRQESYLPWAGLFAGLGYLTKASMGWFFLLAAAGGFLWRFSFMGPRVFRSRPYQIAGAIFVAFIVVWAGRNVANFWDGSPGHLLVAWQTSAYTAAAVATGFAHLDRFALGLLLKLPILVLAVLVPYGWLLPELRRGARRWREEETSGLILATGLVFVLGWIFSGLFWVVEQTSAWWADGARYLAPAYVPLLWLAVREKPDGYALPRWIGFGVTSLLLTWGMRYLLMPGAPFSWT